jgi:hypothetical protein
MNANLEARFKPTRYWGRSLSKFRIVAANNGKNAPSPPRTVARGRQYCCKDLPSGVEIFLGE